MLITFEICSMHVIDLHLLLQNMFDKRFFRLTRTSASNSAFLALSVALRGALGAERVTGARGADGVGPTISSWPEGGNGACIYMYIINTQYTNMHYVLHNPMLYSNTQYRTGSDVNISSPQCFKCIFSVTFKTCGLAYHLLGLYCWDCGLNVLAMWPLHTPNRPRNFVRWG